MSGQHITCNTGTVPVINQIDGNELCVTLIQSENNKCPKTYLAGKAVGSNYVGCFDTSKYQNPTSSLTPSSSPSPSPSKCKNYIQVSTPNDNYNPPMGSFISQSTINYCKKSLCRDDKNKIVLVSNNSLPSYVCP
jgi:hypothetical protein